MNAKHHTSSTASTGREKPNHRKMAVCLSSKRFAALAGIGSLAGAVMAALMGYQLAAPQEENQRLVPAPLPATGSVVQAEVQARGPAMTTEEMADDVAPTGEGSTPVSHLENLRTALEKATTPEGKRDVSDALISLDTEEALSAWGQALIKESQPAARKAMMDALDNLQGEVSVEMITQLVELSDAPEIFDGVARTLARMATPDTPAYLADIHAGSPDDSKRERSLSLLAGISNPYAVPGLASVLNQPAYGDEVTSRAATSLSKIGDPASVISLSGAYRNLPSDSTSQRQVIVDAIASVTNPQSRTLLEDMAANSKDSIVAAAAAEALANLHPLTAEDAGAAPSELPSPSLLVAKAPQE